jgi:hypothetical protein
MFDKDDRVMTPQGPGTVKYRRMAPPEYSKPASYSVLLDPENRPKVLGYSGTIFAAEKIDELNPIHPKSDW